MSDVILFGELEIGEQFMVCSTLRAYRHLRKLVYTKKDGVYVRTIGLRNHNAICERASTVTGNRWGLFPNNLPVKKVTCTE